MRKKWHEGCYTPENTSSHRNPQSSDYATERNTAAQLWFFPKSTSLEYVNASCWPCFFGASSRSTDSACAGVGRRKTTTAVSGICCGISERIQHCPLQSVSDPANEKYTRYTYLGGVRKTRRDLWTRAGRCEDEARCHLPRDLIDTFSRCLVGRCSCRSRDLSLSKRNFHELNSM